MMLISPDISLSIGKYWTYYGPAPAALANI